ncbi:hypothetical protein [Salinibacterium sp.]|nr:hypothetical protein [Salinibacterium sp.]
MTNITPAADDRIHSAADNQKAIDDREKLENSDLSQDERDRLDSHS